MCSHCREGKSIETNQTDLQLKIHDNKLSIDYRAYSCDSDLYKEIEIKFCPMCGQEL